MNDITAWCVKEREALGWTQEELADEAGITLAMLRVIEGGGAPTGTVLRKLAAVLPTNEEQDRRWKGITK